LKSIPYPTRLPRFWSQACDRHASFTPPILADERPVARRGYGYHHHPFNIGLRRTTLAGDPLSGNAYLGAGG